MIYNNYIYKALLVCVIAMCTSLYGQNNKARPTVASSEEGYRFGPVLSSTEMQKAYDTDENSYTELETGVSVGFAISPYFSLGYASNIDATKPFYLKISMNDSQLLDAVAGGIVGDALNDIIAGLVGGVPNSQFVITNSANAAVFSAETKSFNSVDVNKFRFVLDPLGNYYARFLPGVPFNKVTTRLYTAGLITTDKFTRIHDSFYFNENSNCTTLFTYVNASQELLSLLGGGNKPVNNPHFAIDNNVNTASVFSNSGLISVDVGKTVEQIFDLPKAVTDKKLQIKFRMPYKLVGLNIASGLKAIFYKNGVPYPEEIGIDSSILNLDVLGLINSTNNRPFSVTIDPPVDAITGNIKSYDRVGIKFTKPIGVSLLAADGDLEIYDIAFVDVAPTEVNVCTKLFTLQDGGFVKKFDITQLIPGFTPAKFAQYVIIDESHNALTFTNAASVETQKWLPLGKYLIRGIDGTGFCIGQYYTYYTKENPVVALSGKSTYLIKKGSSLDFSTLNYTVNQAGYTVVGVFDELTNSNVTATTRTFNEIGSYIYYVKATNASMTCDVIKQIKVNVYDLVSCDYRYIKKMASTEDVNYVSLLGLPLGGSYNSANAVDNDLSTYSTIFNVASLLGIGTTWQDLKFNSPITRGTPLTIKLGKEYSGVNLISAMTVRPIDATGKAIGRLVAVGEVDVVSVLSGDRTFEYTFIPTDDNGNQIDYLGVRIHLGGVLGVADNMKIFGAYVEEENQNPNAPNPNCIANIEINGAAIPSKNDGKVFLNSTTEDVLWGVQGQGLNIATALSSVVYPYLAADKNYINVNGDNVSGLDSYAIFNTAASVLNSQNLVVKFKEVARPGDKVRIIFGSEDVGILNIGLLKNFTIHRYLGDDPVGDPVTNDDFSLINLNLLGLFDNTEDKYAVVIDESTVPFDRVEIRFTHLADVQLLGEYTYVYDVSLIPYLDINQSDAICTDQVLDVEKADVCTSYQISFAYKKVIDGSPVDNPMYEWVDIPGSALRLIYENDQIYRFRVPYNPELKAIYNTRLNEMLGNVQGSLYMKMSTSRQGCQLGDPQFVKINSIGKCNGMISNPMIRTILKPY